MTETDKFGATTYGRVIALSLDGMRPSAIAEQLGLSIWTIYDHRCAARRAGIDLPSTRVKYDRYSVVLHSDQLDKIRPIATMTQQSLDRVIRTLIECAGPETLDRCRERLDGARV